MKLGIVAVVAASLILALAGCSSEDKDKASTSLSGAATSASQAAESIAARAGNLFDDAKAQAFVIAFRAQFSQLAENRDDNAIKQLLTNACTEITSGNDQSKVVAGLQTQAASGGNSPTVEQAQRIYDQAKAACS